MQQAHQQRLPSKDLPVPIVDGSRVHADEDLIGLGNWRRHVAQLEPSGLP